MSKLRVDKIAAPIVQDEFTGSVYFDGDSDYLRINGSVTESVTTDDFTIEGWIYKDSTGTNAYFFDCRPSTGAADGNPLIYITGSTLIYYRTATHISTTMPLNQWVHIALTRESGVYKLWMDGVLQGTHSDSTSVNLITPTSPVLGTRSSLDNTYSLKGYISNFRICKGHAVYTSNFTPPTRELPVHKKPPKGVVQAAVDNVTVLLVCQSSTDATLDSSGRHTITVGGDAHAQSTNPGLLRKTNIFSKYSEDTGSVFFDGISDTLGIVENGNDFDYDADFSIEFWVYFNELKSYQDIAGTSTNSVFLGSNKSGWVASYYTSGTDQFRFSYQDDSSWTFQHAFNFAASTNTWYHVAYQRHDGSIKLYVNGSQIGSTYSTSTNLISTENRLLVGSGHGVSPGSTGHFHGYLSNLRICKGHAVYKSNFTPPTKELDVHPQSVLLACHDGENIFADKTGRHIIAAYGDRLSSPTPTATDSPIGITTFQPGLIRDVDSNDGPTFQGGVGYNSQNWLTLPKGTTTDKNRIGGRGLVGGGDITPASESESNHIDLFNIPTMGNSIDFGDLSDGKLRLGASGSSTRGIFAGGKTPSLIDVIEYVTIAATGNAVDFGNLLNARDELGGAGNNIRALFFTGSAPGSTNVIEYVTTATLGDAKDFGDLTRAALEGCGCGSPTRGVLFVKDNSIDYVTWATTGNAQDFGDTGFGNNGDNSAASDSTRALIAGGAQGPSSSSNGIHYLTISTLGNTQDFGDLTAAATQGSGMSNSTRGVFQLGNAGGSQSNAVDYVTIQTTGNAKDFGDLSPGRVFEAAACSDSHGAIG